ncbi:MATE family efflux transporter [Kordiimonas aquimaris]|uniref:MATE family efflux transporter n=1 Tax=Kordiimonas aquimaris TaxID=707591 RepID=UPI0021D1A5F6|nr:MATE family efflux transporter [Kordiimonas aquimaris]
MFDRQWITARLKRHTRELVRLAAPAVMMRIGLMGLAMVDTAMVGHYATQHLAWLNLANQSVIMFALVIGLGLLSGIIIYATNAYGGADFKGAGKVWRRNLPFSLLVGGIIVAACWPAEFWLLQLGQTPENAAVSGDLVRILALGLPGHLLFVNCTMFLEGIKRPHIGFQLTIGANIVNVFLNYMLIFGHFGAPELGAEGSAWASTGVRWFMAITAMMYVWNAASLRKFRVREPHLQKLVEWRDQRQMGYASGTSLAAEVIAFSALAIFAGWIGTVPLAAFGVVYQVLGIPLMIAIGIGVATTVRVGIALSRNDGPDAALAAVAGIIMTILVCGFLAILIYAFTKPMLGIFTSDLRIIDMLIPFALVYISGMIFDAAQMVASMVLRGYKETWWPTYLQGFAFIFVMLPTSYYLAFPMDRGFQGLMEGMLIGVFVSLVLQLIRFIHLAKRSINNLADSAKLDEKKLGH